MRDVDFEYYDSKTAWKYGLTVVFLTFILGIGLIPVATSPELFTRLIYLSLVFGVPYSIIYLNKKKFKKQGLGSIYHTHCEFKLASSNIKIDYADIETYDVLRFNGTHLRVRLKNGQRIKIETNIYFCNPDQFDVICQHLDFILQQYEAPDNTEKPQNKSMLMGPWMLVFLIVLTLGVIGGLIYAINEGKNIPPSFYTAGLIIVPLWLLYMKERKKGRHKAEE